MGKEINQTFQNSSERKFRGKLGGMYGVLEMKRVHGMITQVRAVELPKGIPSQREQKVPQDRGKGRPLHRRR